MLLGEPGLGQVDRHAHRVFYPQMAQGGLSRGGRGPSHSRPCAASRPVLRPQERCCRQGCRCSQDPQTRSTWNDTMLQTLKSECLVLEFCAPCGHRIPLPQAASRGRNVGGRFGGPEAQPGGWLVSLSHGQEERGQAGVTVTCHRMCLCF